MPNRYVLHAMGIKKGLLHQKMHLAHFFNSSHSPIKHLQLGSGAGHRRSDSDSDSEQVGGSPFRFSSKPHGASPSGNGLKHRPHKLKPISFKF